MTAAIVYGYTPHKEFGEIPYTSYVYHIFTNEQGDLQFLVWNPFTSLWEIKRESLVRPMSISPQDVPTNDKFKEYKKWLEEKQRKNG